MIYTDRSLYKVQIELNPDAVVETEILTEKSPQDFESMELFVVASNWKNATKIAEELTPETHRIKYIILERKIDGVSDY